VRCLRQHAHHKYDVVDKSDHGRVGQWQLSEVGKNAVARIGIGEIDGVFENLRRLGAILLGGEYEERS